MTRREPTAHEVVASITKLTIDLVRSGLADDQILPSLATTGRRTTITTSNPVTAASMRAPSYRELYEHQARERIFNVVLLDKAILQMSYEWDGRRLVKHRLAFLPSPDLLEFQNNPDLYLREQLYVDVVGPQRVAVPLRFDFDSAASEADHPAAHLTLGQYQHCRVPVSAPVTPAVFVDFLVRHFYSLPGMRLVEVDLDLDRRFELTGGREETVFVSSPGRR